MQPTVRSIVSAKQLFDIWYSDSIIKKGKVPTQLEKLAPAPGVTSSAGNAQQIKVDVDANSEKKLADLFCISFTYNLDISGI